MNAINHVYFLSILNCDVSFITQGTFVSIAFFNFAGVSVTKEMSATTRMVLDSVRTLVIWAVSLALRWQTFNYLQVCREGSNSMKTMKVFFLI